MDLEEKEKLNKIKQRLSDYVNGNQDDELVKALSEIVCDIDYPILEKIYFEHKSLLSVSMETYYDRSTISRKLIRLIRRLACILYENK